MDRFLPTAGKAGGGGRSTFGQEESNALPWVSVTTSALDMGWDRESWVETSSQLWVQRSSFWVLVQELDLHSTNSHLLSTDNYKPFRTAFSHCRYDSLLGYIVSSVGNDQHKKTECKRLELKIEF